VTIPPVRIPESSCMMRLGVPRGFSLTQTVLSHGWHQMAPFHWDAASSTLWRIESLPGHPPRILRLRQGAGIGTPVRIGIRPGALAAPARKLLRLRAMRMLGMGLDLSDFYRLCRREARLRYVPRTGAGRFLSAGNLYEDVFKAICATNISWKQAVRAVYRIGRLGEPVEGCDLAAFPSPERIAVAGEKRLAKVSRLGYRVPYLLAWAERVASADPGWRAAEEGGLRGKDLREFLLSIRGVGATTSRYLMMMRGFAEEIPVDSSVYLYLRENRFGGRTPSTKDISRLYDRFGDWKAFAYWFEFLPWARKQWTFARGDSAERTRFMAGVSAGGWKDR
jgi:3-methyladenine DNA glycosylase/8-oxoguanine DNA glycosylase